MITVYGADWCHDTRRALRHLRRLDVAHRYLNIDEDSRALHAARVLNPAGADARRTPVIDLGFGGTPLVEPDNDTLTAALVEMQMLNAEEATERLAVQNIGDQERIVRTAAGILIFGVAAAAPRGLKWLFRVAGGAIALSGISGWSAVYYAAGVTSVGGPGDRPREATRDTWLVASTLEGLVPRVRERLSTGSAGVPR
jgi:glutaredoxin